MCYLSSHYTHQIYANNVQNFMKSQPKQDQLMLKIDLMNLLINGIAHNHIRLNAAGNSRD